jgi:outer membrane protein insertion porin family
LKLKETVILFLLCVVFFTSCINSTKYLEQDEYLLYKSKIKGNEKISTDEFEALQRQKPNRRIFGYPIYVWFYFVGKNSSDSIRTTRKIEKVRGRFDRKIALAAEEDQIKKLKKRKKRRLSKLNKKLEKGSLLMQVIRPAAEKPSIFNRNTAEQTLGQMKLYMESKGFFNSKAFYTLDTLLRKRIVITYHITENQPHQLAEINYIIEDTAVAAVIKSAESSSNLKPGENYDVQNFSRERERLEKLLRDNGYYFFNRQYIEFENDTSSLITGDSSEVKQRQRKVNVDVLIHNPPKGNHEVFKIDSVYFNLDGNESLAGKTPTKKYYRHITYSSSSNWYSRRILNYKVFIRPGEKYSQENTIETQRQLLNLDNFKFVNITFDTTGGHFISRITTSNANKFTTSEELGISVSQRLPGPTINATFKNRNIFGGFENFETTARYTFEGVISSGNTVYRSEEFTASIGINFPQTLFPFNPVFKRRLNRLNPKTKLLTSYTFINRPGYYQRANLKGSFQYTWQKGLYKFYSISPIDLSVVRTFGKSTAFQHDLDSLQEIGFPLWYSFSRAIVTSVNGFYTFNNYMYGVNSNAKYFNFYAESGGTIFNLIDNEDFLKEYNRFSYLRFSADMRKYIPTGRKSSFATRINMGFARPYLTKEKALPYEKYFFAGGSSSIRAWAPRQLGPGSFRNTDSNNKRIFYENPGEILLEMSAEERFPMLDFTSTTRLDGAVFVDAGNIWSYYKILDTKESVEKEVRPGAHFEWNRFYKEIAVGGGFGLRLNMSFLIVRVDAAYRFLDPSWPVGQRVVIDDIAKAKIDDPYGNRIDNPNRYPTIHLGVNYPF